MANATLHGMFQRMIGPEENPETITLVPCLGTRPSAQVGLEVGAYEALGNPGIVLVTLEAV